MYLSFDSYEEAEARSIADCNDPKHAMQMKPIAYTDINTNTEKYLLFTEVLSITESDTVLTELPVSNEIPE